MNNTRVSELSVQINEAIPALLGPLRTQKQLDRNALTKIEAILVELSQELSSSENVSKQLVGRLWFIFTSMLGEAEHAKNRDEIEIAAWGIQEKLRRIFGPHF